MNPVQPLGFLEYLILIGSVVFWGGLVWLFVWARRRGQRLAAATSAEGGSTTSKWASGWRFWLLLFIMFVVAKAIFSLEPAKAVLRTLMGG